MEMYEDNSLVQQDECSVSKEELLSTIDKLSEIEKSFAEVDQDQNEVKSWMLLKDIDLTMALDAIVYRAKIDNKFCDVKKVILNLENGFSQLKCTQSGCSEKAVMWHKLSNDIPAKLYCEKHSNLIVPQSESQHYFDRELKDDWKILTYIERLLVVVQEQMECLKNENANNDTTEYREIKANIDEGCWNLKNILSDMTVKAEKIIAKEAKTDKTPQYELLSFVKSDSQKWIQSIFGVLRLIFEVNMKAEIEAKLKTILNWSSGIEQYNEESKSSSVYSIPNEIYGNEFELCKIPTQTLNKMKELEKRVQTLAKAAIAYKKVIISYLV